MIIMMIMKVMMIVALQVQWNLFTVHTLTQTGDRETGVITKASQFFVCREVEENFRKNLTTQELSEGINIAGKMILISWLMFLTVYIKT